MSEIFFAPKIQSQAAENVFFDKIRSSSDLWKLVDGMSSPPHQKIHWTLLNPTSFLVCLEARSLGCCFFTTSRRFSLRLPVIKSICSPFGRSLLINVLWVSRTDILTRENVTRTTSEEVESMMECCARDYSISVAQDSVSTSRFDLKCRDVEA